MLQFNLDDLLDMMEQHYQFKHETGELLDFRALTAQDGEVYIEYKYGKHQVNVWITLDHPNLYKRIESVSEIVAPKRKTKEVEWGAPQGSEVW